MIRQGTTPRSSRPGSKQGITCPPGDTAYNASKAGVKVVTEGLAHELRNVDNCQVTAHLLIPGFTFTGLKPFPGRPQAARRLDGRTGRRLPDGRHGGGQISMSFARTTK